VASFGQIFLRHTRNFFTNWSRSDLPVGRKVVLTVRNRSRALLHGCCGHHGEPGC
jgi:hypothetical protein